MLFRVLGGVAVVLSDGREVAVRSAKQRRLLTVLLMNANHRVSSARPHHQIGELADRLAALTVGTEPDISLRVAFDQSYTALPTGAQALFRWSTLLPDPDFSADGRSTSDAVDLLCAEHLVDHHEPHRYRIHGLPRAYGAEPADQGGDSDRVVRVRSRTAAATRFDELSA